MNKKYSRRAWAVVTKEGRVQVDTVCAHKENAENFLSDFDEMKGAKVRCIRITCEWKQ